jgi:hypothetical protein
VNVERDVERKNESDQSEYVLKIELRSLDKPEY